MAAELPKGTGRTVVAVGGVFLLCLGVFLCVAVADGPSGGGATIGQGEPPRGAPTPRSATPETTSEAPCFLYLEEGNALNLPASLDRVPTFVSRDALLRYARARVGRDEAGSADALEGLASLERRGTKVEVLAFDLTSMKVIGSKGPAWIHPTWCHDEPAR